MHRHQVQRVLPFTPDQLFELVGGVEAYPEFVPWITYMSVTNKAEVDETTDRIDAEAGVGFSFLQERFKTRVMRDKVDREIEVRLISGPFRHLSNDWRFEEHPQGCRVKFEIEFAFRSRLLDMLLAANFDRAVTKLIACFEARAREIYTPVSA
jgi:coenzyme Q-binding protein COQ10